MQDSKMFEGPHLCCCPVSSAKSYDADGLPQADSHWQSSVIESDLSPLCVKAPRSRGEDEGEDAKENENDGRIRGGGRHDGT